MANESPDSFGPMRPEDKQRDIDRLNSIAEMCEQNAKEFTAVDLPEVAAKLAKIAAVARRKIKAIMDALELH